jgi:choline dehydrogenase-like flavoprotein
MKNKRVNAVVIGAGAGGGIVAKELAVSGLSVVLFERGKWPVYDEHPTDELISQRTEVLGSPFGPNHIKNPRVVVEADGRRRIVTPISGGYSNNAACVGSGTVSYGAMAWRFMEEDFQLKTVYGQVEGSTLEDWPISYDDLETCYEKAEWEIGVSGNDGRNPFAPPRRNKQPMPPFEYNPEGKVIYNAAKRLGLHPFPIPMLRNSVRYNNRPACIRNRMCCGFACPVDAKNGTHNTVIPTAMRTGNCEVLTQCMIAEIVVDDKGQAEGVNYFDSKNKGHFQPADIVVVSGGAIETARLLLNSKSKLFPRGAGNNYDWVGRNLQGHAYTGAFGLFDYDILDLAGPGATVALCDFNHHNPGMVGGGLLANEFNRLPYLFTNIRPPGSARWGIDHKKFQYEMYRRTSQVVGPIQEMPAFDSRVTVDENVKDYWGSPVARLSGSRHPLDYENCRFLSAKAEEILKEAGAYYTWQSVGGRGLSGGQHQAGTARMGHDKKTSVVNRFGQVHEIDNLFIADGSLMVNNSGFNPALTIMALGYWVGDYIATNFSSTKFRAG